jgi:polysaccharide transporter, PST family
MNLSSHKDIKSIIALLASQMTTMILPLVTTPFLARHLSKEVWGEIIFCQSIVLWTVMLTEYNLGQTAVRYILKDQNESIYKLFLSVNLLKFIIAIVIISILSILYCFVFSQKIVLSIFLGSICVSFFQALSPLWVFQAREMLSRAAFIDSVLRLSSILFIVLFVRSDEDAWIVLFAQALGFMLSTMILSGITRSRWGENIGFSKIYVLSIELFKEGLRLFYSKVVVYFYQNFAVLMVAFLYSPILITTYGIADRIMRIFATLFTPINQVIYPRMIILSNSDQKKARIYAVRVFSTQLIFGVFISIALYIFGKYFISLVMGREEAQIYEVLRILAVWFPISIVNYSIGNLWLIPNSLERFYNKILVFASIVNILSILVLRNQFGFLGIPISIMVVEYFVFFFFTSCKHSPLKKSDSIKTARFG